MEEQLRALRTVQRVQMLFDRRYGLEQVVQTVAEVHCRQFSGQARQDEPDW